MKACQEKTKSCQEKNETMSRKKEKKWKVLKKAEKKIVSPEKSRFSFITFTHVFIFFNVPRTSCFEMPAKTCKNCDECTVHE